MSHRRVLISMLCLAVAGMCAYGIRRHFGEKATRTLSATIATSTAGGDRVKRAGTDPRLTQTLEKLPLSFERRDWSTAGTKFVSSGPNYSLGVTNEGATLMRRFKMGADSGTVLNPEAGLAGTGTTAVSQIQFHWLGANPASELMGEQAQKGVSNYFPTSDQRTWRKHVPHYGSVRLAELYKGVDLRFHGDHEALEFDYDVKAGADPSAIRMGIGAPSIVTLTPDGELQILENGDAIRLEKPAAYQDIRGTRTPVEVKYALADSHELRFALGAYDKSQPLVIDPVLAFSAYFGASSNLNLLADVALDGSGNIYVTGRSCDVDYPVTPGVIQPTGGSITAEFCDTGVITVLDPTASTLIYSTYFGSQNSTTSGLRILPASGGALVAGVSTATDLPTTANAYQKTSLGGTCDYGPYLKGFPCSDGFVLELNSDGSQIIFATYLGGSRADMITNMVLDASGNIFLAGASNSADFPVTPGTAGASYGGGMCQSGLYPCFDGFVAKMSSDGSKLLEATFLGGNDDDFASGIAVDSSGAIYVGGTAYSTNFPTTSGSYQPTHSSGADQGDAFVTKLTPDMKTLTYSTFVGGTGFDIGLALALDSAGEAYVVGSTNSTDFPTSSGAFQTTYAGPTPANTGCDTYLDSNLLNQPSCGDIFVTKLNAAGSALVYSTYIGGSGPDIAFRASLDSKSDLWILANVGYSTNFPYTSDAYYTSTSDNIALIELSSDGTKLPYATPLAEGNTGQSLALGLTLDSADDVYVAGQATSFMGTPGTFSSGIGPSVFVAKYVQGTAAPAVTLSSTLLNFQGAVTGSATAPQSVTLTNSGTATLNLKISPIAGDGQTAVPFSEYDNCGNTVAAGASCTINVVYAPTSATDEGDSAQLTIIDNAPNAPRQIQIVGGGGPIDTASFVPATLTFDGQGPGSTSAAQSSDLSTAASGGQTAQFPTPKGTPVVSGPNASEFSVDSSSCVTTSSGCYLTVTFTPAANATGTRTATVSVPTNAANSPQVLTLSGTVVTGPYAIFSPAYLIPTQVGQTQNSAFSVTNTGGATLNVTGETFTGANASDFALSSASCSVPSFSLAPGQACSVYVAFTPGAHGARTATLTLQDNEAKPASETLNGFGTTSSDAAFAFITTPDSVNGQILYADTIVGTTNFFVTYVSLLNEGQAAGTVTSITTTGDFSQTNNCTGSIPVEGSCELQVTFAPKAAGARTGTLTMVTSGPGPQTLTLNLAGNGVLLPQVALTPANLSFSDQAMSTTSAPQTVTLKNTGNGPLNLSNIAVSGPFAQTNNCPGSLAAGASCAFSVTFTPTSAAPAGGLLSFTGNASGLHFSAGLNGTGVTGATPLLTPTSLTFGDQAQGTVSPAQTVMLSNPGTASFAFNGLQASQNYQASSNCPATIAAGGSCTISVKFAPTSSTFTGGFPAYGAVYVSLGTKGSPLTINTNGTPQPSNGAATNLLLSSAPNPSTVGQSVTFTATVQPVTPGATPTGTVTFFNGSAGLGNPITLVGGVGMLKTSVLAQGNNSIYYTYSGDSTYVSNTSSGIVQVVNGSSKATTTTAVTSTPNPATAGQSVKFTASVTSTTSGTITGTVQFYDGATAIGSPVTLAAGSASYSTATLSQGSHSITAAYSGDSTYGTSTSTVLTQTISAGTKASTTTSVKSSLNPSTSGASVTFTANVSSSTAGTITGTVQFYDGATALGAPVTLASGAAMFSTSSLVAGSHTITATYSGDSNYSTSTSTALTQTVNAATKATSTTAVTSSLNPSTVGASVTFTASVSSATAGTITGTVTFYDGATALGAAVPVAAGTAMFSTSSLAAGSHSIMATYSGDTNYATSTSTALGQTVNASTKPATATAVTSSLNPSTTGTSVTFTASVSSKTTGTITGTVTFYDGATALGSAVTLTSGMATYTTSALAQGAHSITAAYSGDSNFAASTSPVLTQTVNAASKGATTTAVTSSLNPSTAGANVTFTAMVMSSQAGTVTGSVQFYDGGTALGSAATLASGMASYSTATLAQGSHMITAQYGGDTNYQASTSTAVTQTVNASSNGDFSVSVSPTSLSVPVGRQGAFSVGVMPVNGSTETVSLSCTGLPANSSCSFASNSVTLDGKDTANVSAAIVTTKGGGVPSIGPLSNSAPPALPAVWQAFATLLAAMSSLLLIRSSKNRAWRLALAMALLVLPALAITACSNPAANSGTPKGTYTITVTGTSGTTTHSSQLSVMVD